MLTERPVITWRLLENKSRDVQRDFAGGGDGNVLILDYVASFITVYVFKNSKNQAIYLACELYLNKDGAFFQEV